MKYDIIIQGGRNYLETTIKKDMKIYGKWLGFHLVDGKNKRGSTALLHHTSASNFPYD